MISSFPLFEREQALLKSGYTRVCGLDEAGRGPLAGPVVAACVILSPGNIPAGITDSKRLSPHKRKELAHDILNSSAVGVGFGDLAIIAEKNILQASLHAMEQAFFSLSPRPDYALVDGLFLPALPCPAQAFVKGDQRVLSIAAASIIAKVTRDRLMEDLDREYPGYGFARHKGYGTREHLRALEAFGPTPHHRTTFRPIRDLRWAKDKGGG